MDLEGIDAKWNKPVRERQMPDDLMCTRNLNNNINTHKRNGHMDAGNRLTAVRGAGLGSG